MSNAVLLELRAAAKAHGARLLFKNLSLSLKKGRGALLLGANGSGKSSLLRVMAGLSKPSRGSVSRMPGLRLAYLGHASFLYLGLTALENLAFWQKARSAPSERRVLEAALDLTGLLPFANEPVRGFSKGMAQRLALARVFLEDAELYLLDEPFSGLDQPSREIIMAELLKKKKGGAALFMASHNPLKDGALADEIFILEKKRLERQDIPRPRESASAETARP